ncbi:Protein sel-1-like protein 1 [Colletotrichum orbiculare MAFF 240422]|uniref:Protein sel-1-like protein 1 n=1 Tax=Colletotrichum orbiculare (strain 104-T / ATCC 96160 / CBS 514.97 / LARS 414 / MAFF 240422) TaxID=1213857 RepID=A0A484FPE5_COLOR|nr:Protein sel-1-like protein 1 [Colletotrichum orbiculare MAFF 240422]
MRLSFWLPVLLQVSAISGAEQKVVKLQDEEASSTHARIQTEVATEQHAPLPRQPGAELVDLAVEQLARLPSRNYPRRERRYTLVSSALRYALKLVPSLKAASAPGSTQAPEAKVSGPLLDAVRLLEQSALQNNSDALYLLADMNFYGNWSYPRDLKVAFDHYHSLATLHGNRTAQYMLGLYYATGIGHVVAPDQAKALLYYSFAAIQGDTRAEMAVGYRHHGGIATPKDCEVASKYYKRVADKAMEWYRSGPPGGMAWVVESYRIADELGGVYGEGASASSAGMNAMKASPNSDANAAIDDVIEYLDLMSQKGDAKASYNLGRIYYDGQRGLDRDLDLARKYFFTVAKRYWKKDGRLLDNHKQGIEKTASKAAGFIGWMYLRGDGIDQSFDQAKRWFERGISHGDAQSQYGLGLMMLHGYGTPKNIAMATDLFKAAAEQDYAPAQIELGVLYLDQGGAEDVRIANNYFELAARYGQIEAHYYLAEMIYHGVGRDKTCSMALGYYKNVAEKAEPLVSSWAEANQAYYYGDHELAFLEYVMAAEQGYERAQNNVAFILDPLKSSTPLPDWLALPQWLGAAISSSSLLKNPRLALMYWTRSSRQSNVDSQVKMGDYYFFGIGSEPEVNKAVQCYTGASDYSQSAQALWNLGWMHENGIGLTQDFHLAKRYYDQALEVNEEAYLPVTLSLFKLRIRSAWNTLTHGPVHSIQDDPKPKKDWSVAEWIANFLQDDQLYYDDPYYEDIFDDTIGGGPEGGVLEEDGIGESLIIVFLALSLVMLLYYRQQRQQQHRRDEEARTLQQQQRQQQQGQPARPPPPPGQQQQDQGFFPRPGEPEFNQWVAGGIGH